MPHFLLDAVLLTHFLDITMIEFLHQWIVAFFGTKKVQLKLKDGLKGKGQIVIPFNKVEELNQFWDKIEED